MKTTWVCVMCSRSLRPLPPPSVEVKSGAAPKINSKGPLSILLDDFHMSWSSFPPGGEKGVSEECFY